MLTLTSLDGKLLLTFPTYIPTYDADDAKKAIELNKTRYDISSDINFKNLSNQMDSWVKDTKRYGGKKDHKPLLKKQTAAPSGCSRLFPVINIALTALRLAVKL